ncbi:hypothetical protein VUR80DRAFT_4448 [Thermomyces stellatus]
MMIAPYILIVSLLAKDMRAVEVGDACQTSTFESLLDDNEEIESVDVVEQRNEYGEGEENVGYPQNPTELPELCAVTVRVKSSEISSFRFGLFLPTDWNSKLLTVGNGGFAGGINWLDMGPGTHHGFATASTDTGHSSNATDLSWALNNEERRRDWGWRAIHGTVDLSKRLVEAYYGEDLGHSYYAGCSTGGRQGLRELQSFPDSFDGAIIGAPAWNPPLLNTYVTRIGTYNLPSDDAKHIPEELLEVIHEEVLRQCDGLDGVDDGIISAPELCDVDLEPLSCDREGIDKSRCFTEPQLDTVRKIYANFYVVDKFVWSGYDPGSELQWSTVITNDDPSAFGVGFQRYFVNDDPEWSWRSFNNSLFSYAADKNPGESRADKYDLSEFRDRGGKIIMYHGAADGLVPTRGSNVYYDRVSDTMGRPPTDFFRYFLVPGMQHCWDTAVDAPWYFAAPFQAGVLGNDTWSVPGFRDSEHDILLALVDWVEEGKPVESLVATTWTVSNDSDTDVLRQRPLCPYPEKAIYHGEGDADQASSWHCDTVDLEDGDPMLPPSAMMAGLWTFVVLSLTLLF